MHWNVFLLIFADLFWSYEFTSQSGRRRVPGRHGGLRGVPAAALRSDPPLAVSPVFLRFLRSRWNRTLENFQQRRLQPPTPPPPHPQERNAQSSCRSADLLVFAHQKRPKRTRESIQHLSSKISTLRPHLD